MEVYVIPNGYDNFMYYITLDKKLPGLFIDVYEPEKAIQFLNK